MISDSRIKTPLADLQPPEAIARILATIPMGRMGDRSKSPRQRCSWAQTIPALSRAPNLFADGGRGQV
jgi:hypothetical protein